jgi:hypothetical protein
VLNELDQSFNESKGFAELALLVAWPVMLTLDFLILEPRA